MSLNKSRVVLSERQNAILELARQEGEALVDGLAERFDVTPQTIRRDLNVLCHLHLLQRVHGGATPMGGVENLGYAARKRLALEEKSAIGRCAAELIPNDSSLFINIGTTTEQVAENLLGHTGLLVITNNLNVVNTLLRNETIDVMMAGGIVRREDGGIVGEATSDFIAQFKVDYAVIGASAIEEDGTILDFDAREVHVTRSIIRNARSTILVADSMKFERNAPVRIANVADIEHVVTDRPPPAPFTATCERSGVEMHVAPGAGSGDEPASD